MDICSITKLVQIVITVWIYDESPLMRSLAPFQVIVWLTRFFLTIGTGAGSSGKTLGEDAVSAVLGYFMEYGSHRVLKLLF